MVIVVWLRGFVWLQIASQFACCIGMIIYLGFVWPFEIHVITLTEIFNEIAVLLLCYFMFCFTDWIPEATTRYMIGWVFISIICLHLLGHLVMLLRDTYSRLRNKFRKRFAKILKRNP